MRFFFVCVCFLVSYIRRLCLTQDQCCNYCFKRSFICPHVYHFWYSLCIPMYRSPFILKDCLKISCRWGLSFCLFGNILISPLFVKNFTAHRILGRQLTFALWICNSKAFGLHCLRIQMLILTMVHYMLSSFAAFKVPPFPLPRVVSLKVQLGISMFFLFEGYWTAWIYRLFLSNFGSFQQLFFSSCSLRVYLILPYRLLKLHSLFFQLILFYSSYWIVSIKQSLNSLIHLSAVWNLLLGPSGDFFCF